MGKPKAPPAPDYAAAAREQGAANLDAARTSARISNPNITNPYGSQTVTFGGPKVFDEAGYNKAMEDYQAKGTTPESAQYFDSKAYLEANPGVAANAKYGQNAFGHYQDWGKGEGRTAYWKAPTKEMFTTDSDPDRVSVNQTLSPEQQALFDQENRISTGMGNLAEGGISRVGQMLGTSYDKSGLPGMTGSVQAQRTDPMTGDIVRGFGPTAGSVQYGIDPRFDQSGQQVQEALYRKQTGMLDPQYQQSESDMSARLANQGIVPGSEAYNREMDNFARQKTSAYESARDASILAGGQEQSRLNDMGLSRANLNNLAQGQDFGQLAQRAVFNNQAIAQMFGQTLGANNQNFNQDLAAGQFGNQARGQQLQEDMALRQLPLNEINALRTGAQATVPQFQQYSGAQVQPTNTFGATQAQAGADMANYNAKAAQKGALQSGLFSLGSSFLLSDIRAKENIKRIGHLDSGLPVYSYTYKGSNIQQIGVMAQEAEKVFPDAVIRGVHGFKMVDYSKVA